eukprot:scaffold630333_cov17-Prasinocladus_malaysianus.AAC.1
MKDHLALMFCMIITYRATLLIITSVYSKTHGAVWLCQPSLSLPTAAWLQSPCPALSYTALHNPLSIHCLAATVGPLRQLRAQIRHYSSGHNH